MSHLRVVKSEPRRDGPRIFRRASWWWAAHRYLWTVGRTREEALREWRRLVRIS